MMVMRLPILSASSRSWLTKRMVFLICFCSCRSSSCSLVRIRGSRAENGSSISRMGASVAKARARPTRCCMPPDSSCTYLLAHCLRPTSSSCLSTLALRSASGMPASSRPKPAFSRTVRHGSSANCWNTMATCFWRMCLSVAASQEATSTMRSPSLTSTSPPVTLLRPLTARSSVDLPEPERPISTLISPSLTVRLACVAPSTAPVRLRISERSTPECASFSASSVFSPKMMSTFLNSMEAVISCLLTLPQACGQG